MTERNRSIDLCVLLLLGLGLGHAAHAGEGGVRNIEELSLEELLNVVTVSATKLEVPAREAPAIMSVINSDTIENYGYISLNDILYQQPGFAPSQDYDRRTVTARGNFEGWNNNHLLLLIDGVPFNDSIYGSAYTWEITPLSIVKSLDIIRGPGSALYGSNATNGVLGLHTPSASDLPAGMALVRIGNAGTRIFDVTAAHEFTRFSFVIGYNHYETDGNIYSSYDASGRSDAGGKLQQFNVNDARSSDYFFGKVEGSGVLQGLSLQLHLQFWKFGTGQGWLWYIPDAPENMQEDRQIASVAYRPPPSVNGRLQQEYVLQYQRHGINWHMKFYPDNTTVGGVTYPGGLVENLGTEAHQLFARVQYSYRLWRSLSAVAGIEDSLFIYARDSLHNANADINNGGTFGPTPTLETLRPWFEYIANKPVENLGVFAQLASGRILKRKLSITAGVRYDLQYFRYVDVNDSKRPTLSQNFNQVSPRVALVAFPIKDLVIKGIVNRAFRAPAPAELFGANTFTLASNTKELRPESILTVEAAIDWLPIRHLDIRSDWFYEEFANQIAYSVSNNNLSTNLYSRSVTGLEAEGLWDLPLRRAGKLSGFVNYTFTHLISEHIEDPTIAPSDQLTWAPAHTFNVGVSYVGRHIGAALSGHYQGAVERRNSDLPPVGSLSYRPNEVSQWFRLDGRISYQVSNWIRLGVQATNILNTRAYLLKNDNFPFDYQIEGARVLGTLELDLRDIPDAF
jgi:iron complex outermembrane receptor protein